MEDRVEAHVRNGEAQRNVRGDASEALEVHGEQRRVADVVVGVGDEVDQAVARRERLDVRRRVAPVVDAVNRGELETAVAFIGKLGETLPVRTGEPGQ